MTAALLLLSPFDATLLAAENGVSAAQTLRHMGAGRADLATYPRYGYAAPGLSHKEWVVPDFTTAARALAATILRPVLGQSDVCDLSYLPRAAALPRLDTLANVGVVFAAHARQPVPVDMNRRDGADLGLVFHLAIHGQAADRKPYDLLVFPNIAARARQSLERLGRVTGPVLGQYGETIDLAGLRRAMAALNRAAPQPKYLN